MPTSLHCPGGHRWDLDDEDVEDAAGGPVACPFCGTLCAPAAAGTVPPGPAGPAPPPTRTPPPAGTVADRAGPAPAGAARPPARYAPALPRVPGFEVLGVLGQGGMGAVYQARQIKADRVVALKMPHAAADLEQRVRFITEARAVARLQHPNIVQVFEVGETDRVPYMALEFCPGGSLADQLDGTPFPPRAAAELAETVARAVAAAHAAGIVHRDLKPGNILLAGADPDAPPAADPRAAARPKVADFGLARRLDLDDSHTRSGVAIGTPSYMAPEQARGDTKHVGPRADVYALGSVLYELLTGRPPFKGTTVLDTMDQVCTREPVPPTALQPRVPRDLDTITLKCLRKQPEKRYPTADALADDLRRFLDRRPILARPVGWPERLAKLARRHPLPVALVALLLLVAGGWVIWGAWKQVHLAAERDRARDHFRLSMKAIEELLTEVGEDELAAEPRAEETRRKLLEKALWFYEELLGREAGDLSVRWELARATRRVGDIHRLLGRYPDAAAAYGQALARLAALEAAGFDPPERRAEVAHCHNWRGEVYRLTERMPEADDEYQRAIAVRAALVAADPGHAGHALELAQSLYNRGIVAGNSRRFAAARTFFLDARRVLDDVPEPARTAEHRRRYARVEVNLADVLAKDNQLEGAAGAAGHAAEVLRALVAASPTRHEFRYELAVSLLNLVVARVELGAARAAAPAAGEARALLDALVRDFPSTAAYRVELAKVCTAQAAVEFALAAPARAREHTQAAIEHWEGVIRAQPGVPSHHGDLAMALGNLAFLTADPGEARGYQTRSITELLTVLRANADQPDFRTELGVQTRALADRFVRPRDDAAACQLARDVGRAFPDRSQGTGWAVCFLARCAAAARAKLAAAAGVGAAGAAADADRRAEQFATSALELIRAGNAADLAPLLDDGDCDPFRQQARFRAALGRPGP